MVAYRCQYIRCGKKNCKACPHGPYWYSFYRESGKMKSRYHGKADPRPRADEQAEHKAPDPFADIYCRQTATPALAFRILGIPPSDNMATVRRAYLLLVKQCHPDVGGEPGVFQRVEAAWSFLKSYYGWGK